MRRERTAELVTDRLDLTAFEVNQDPASFTARVLTDGPVQWSERHRGWLVLSHQAVTEGFRDTRLSADRIGPPWPTMLSPA